MDFRWNEWNIEHIGGHGVAPEQAEHVVRSASSPFPRSAGDGKFLVWGQETTGRYLQVVFVLDDDDVVFVIHARPLTDREKRRASRERRRRGA